MSDNVGWGVFKGLFAFFILLPICLFGGCLMLGVIGHQIGKEQNRKAAQEKQAQVLQEAEAEKKRQAEQDLRNEQLQNKATMIAAERADQARIQREKQIGNLFALRKERALKGSADACFDLGMMYLKGEGTETNSELGMKYIKIAAQNGYGSAVEFLKTVPGDAR